MKILIITQKADKNDDLLGFMHKWIEKLAQQCRSVIVICLAKGETDLPLNVKVFSLGKEQKMSRWQYVWRFFKYIWQERQNYDLVFVHMNQEYVCLAGLLWKMLGKKIFLWRNHPLGNLFTKIAVALSHRVFCVSEFAFVAKYDKTKLMPAGIDTELFKKDSLTEKAPRSLLYLGRISPIKKIDILIDALSILKRKNIKFNVNIFGNYSPANQEYYKRLRQRSAELALWQEGVRYPDAPKVYNRFETFVNLTPSGSFDKTTLEAMACESLVLVSNRSYVGKIDARLIFMENNADDLARKIETIFSMTGQTKTELGAQLRDYVISNHGLNGLITKLMQEFKNIQ